MKILLIGATGQVGFELRRTLAPLGSMVALGSRELDLAQPQSIREKVRAIRPDLIVNAAAYTAVDKAETEAELAFAINGNAPRMLAEEAERLHAGLVHFSTDYVFDGSKLGPYVEIDSTNPVNVYGASKLAGEQAIQAVGAPHLIFRTSWVYGVRGKNFMLTMLRLAKERERLRVVADQFGAPTWSRMIAETTAQAIHSWWPPASQQPLMQLSGIYHLSNRGETSWHGFAQAILRGYQAHQQACGWQPLLASETNVEAITTDQYPVPAKRPANSLLSNGKLQQHFRLQLPDWQETLEMVLAEAATLALCRQAS